MNDPLIFYFFFLIHQLYFILGNIFITYLVSLGLSVFFELPLIMVDRALNRKDETNSFHKPPKFLIIIDSSILWFLLTWIISVINDYLFQEFFFLSLLTAIYNHSRSSLLTIQSTYISSQINYFQSLIPCYLFDYQSVIDWLRPKQNFESFSFHLCWKWPTSIIINSSGHEEIKSKYFIIGLFYSSSLFFLSIVHK